MRIAFVGTFGLQPKATVSTRAVPLAEALIDRGHEITVITPPWDNPIDSGKEMVIGKVRVLNVDLPPRIPLFWYLALTWRLLIRTLSLRPQVVHAFKPKAFAGLVASALWLTNLLGLTGVKVVVDTDDWEGAGGWNEMGSYSHLQRFFFSLQEKWVLRQADAVTTASRVLAKMVSQLCGDEEKVFYLPNAIGHHESQPVASARNDLKAHLGLQDSFVVLLYTRFFEFGLARILDVLEEILGRLPNAKLLVVGKGFFGEEDRLGELAYERGLSSQVVQAGWVDAQDLPGYFAAADAAIYPFDDTLINQTKCSVKLLDLLSAGVPVVADRVGQNAEYIEDGETGLLIEAGDSRAMAGGVLRLASELDLARKMGEQARRRVRSEFSWALWSKQAERAYEHAAKQKSTLRRALAWLPVALWMGVIFYLSAQSAPPTLPEPILQTLAAKLIHVSVYAVLAYLLFRAYRLNDFLPGGILEAILFSAAVALLYAVSDEYHQSFVPNRHPSPLDVLIDFAGASVSLGFVWRRLTRTHTL